MHHQQCINLRKHTDHLVPVSLDNEQSEFEAELRIQMQTQSTLGRLMNAISAAQSTVHSIWTEDADEESLAILLVTAKDTEHLARIIHLIRRVSGVTGVKRNINA